MMAGIYYGSHVRRLDHLDPGQPSGRGGLGRHLPRRPPDGQAEAAPDPALGIAALGSFFAGTRGHRGADAGGAVLAARRGGVRAARVFQPDGARARCILTFLTQGSMAEGAADGRRRHRARR